MRKPTIGLSVVLSVLLVAIPFSAPASAEGLKQVTINQAFEHLLYIGLYVAKDAGYFAEEGVDVHIATGGGDAQAFSALTGGSAQFAQGDPGFVAIAGEKGW